LAKLFRLWNVMVGRHDCDDRLIVAAARDHRRAVCDRDRSTPSRRLDDQVGRRDQTFERAPKDAGLLGADQHEDLFRPNQRLQPRDRCRQKGLAAIDGKERFRAIEAAFRPKARAPAAGDYERRRPLSISSL